LAGTGSTQSLVGRRGTWTGITRKTPGRRVRHPFMTLVTLGTEGNMEAVTGHFWHTGHHALARGRSGLLGRGCGRGPKLAVLGRPGRPGREPPTSGGADSWD